MLKALRKYLSLRDDEDSMTKRNSEHPDQIIEMGQPMAGAGALLAGSRRKSETERELEKAAKAQR